MDAMTSPPAGPQETATRRPRPAAMRVLTALVEAGPHATIASVTARVGGHPNNARLHLDQLVAEGLAEPAPTPPGGRGRPPKTYRATVAGRQLAGQAPDADGSLALVEAVADQLGGHPEAERTARELGRAWGRRLRGRAAAGAGDLESVLAAQGFTPEAGPDGLRLLTCPFVAAARNGGGLICTLHQGVLDTTSPRPVTLLPFAEPGACVVRPS